MSTNIEELNPGLKDLGTYEYGWADSDVAGATARRGLSEEIVQTQSGCVGPLCGGGPVVCCYPTGAWYAPVAPTDAAAIVERDLEHGEVVHGLAAARLEGAA